MKYFIDKIKIGEDMKIFCISMMVITIIVVSYVSLVLHVNNRKDLALCQDMCDIYGYEYLKLDLLDRDIKCTCENNKEIHLWRSN